MKKCLKLRIMIVLALQAVPALAQKLTENTLAQKQLAIEKRVLEQSIKFNDYSSAIHSIHRIIAYEGLQSTYQDTLAIAYYQTGNFLSTHLIAEKRLKQTPKNIFLAEINASSLKQLGMTVKAITAYEILFNMTNNQYYGYELANLQFSFKRLIEAQKTVDRVLNVQEIENFSSHKC